MSTNNKFSSEEIESAFESIKSHKLFLKSALQERILRYLIDQALAENDVKEQTIGVELLDENYDQVQSNSKVRVYVYNLRKKLAEYYKTDGKDEKIRFSIEKGQYNLTFKEKAFKDTSSKSFNSINIQLPLKPTLVFLGLMILALTVFIVQKNNQTTYLWKPFFTKEKATLCIVADQYIVSDKLQKCFSIYHQIYDDTSLNEFSEKNPELDLRQAWFTMTTKMAPFGIHYLDQWFGAFNRSFDLQLESETQFSDYSNGNVIYIGQSKTMNNSKSVFLKNSQVFKMDFDGFTYTNKDKVIHYTSKIRKIDYEEYTMVSFQRINNGNYTLFFVSNHDVGVLGTIKMFTSEDKLNAFYKNLPGETTEFNALYKVTGLERNDMNCELVQLEVLN